MDPKAKTNENQDQPSIEQLQQQLAESQEKLQEAERLRGTILQDPDIRAVLEAKAAKKPVKVTSSDDEPAPAKKSLREVFGKKPEVDRENVDYDQLTQSQFLDIISESIETYVEDRLKSTVDTSFKIVGQKFDEVLSAQEKLNRAVQQQALSSGAAELTTKYPDFGAYDLKAVQEVMKRTGLGMEDAYLLLKAKNASANPTTDLERPTDMPLRENRSATPFNRRKAAETDNRSETATRNFRDIVNRGVSRALRPQE